jgi:hypothetical protein
MYPISKESLMKQFLKYISILSLCFSPLTQIEAQTISVTATITDSDSQTWNNGSFSIQLNGNYFYNGTPISSAPQIGSLNSSGALSITLHNTSTLSPSGAQYQWTICSQTSASCSTFQTSVITANLSTLLSSLVTAPRFSAGYGTYGYLDIEAVSGLVGYTYYNVSTPAWRQCTVVTSGSCSTWATVGSGGGGAVNSVSNSDGTISISPTTGSVVASLNLAHANTWSVGQIFNAGITASGYSGITGNQAYIYLPNGTVAPPALPANSWGLLGPVSGGTSYAIKGPATMTAGLAHFATPAVGVDGVLESNLTSSLVAIGDLSATGTPSSTTFLRGDNTWAAAGGGLSGLTNGTYPVATSATTIGNGLITGSGETLAIDGSGTAATTTVTIGNQSNTHGSELFLTTGGGGQPPLCIINPFNTAACIADIDSNGNFNGQSVNVNNFVTNNTPTTVVNCSTSGTATFTQPEVGTGYKVVMVYLAACLGTASRTFGTAFGFTPMVLSQSLASLVSSVSTTAVTVTGTTSTGFIELTGY